MIERYRRFYAALQFERGGVFALVQQAFGISQALYPGCFVHITPSLYIPHMVYVDRHPEARAFFADTESIAQFIERNKHYKRSAYINFVAGNFSAPLPLAQASFDLLISIYASGIALACKQYLKPGGLLLTLNRKEADAAGFRLDFSIQFLRGKYTLIEGDPFAHLAERRAAKRATAQLRQGNYGVEYVENETYFLYTKRRLSEC